MGTLCIAQISQRVLSSLLAVGRVRLCGCAPGLRLDEVGQPALGRRGGRGDGARELGRAGRGGVCLEARRDAAEQRGAWCGQGSGLELGLGFGVGVGVGVGVRVGVGFRVGFRVLGFRFGGAAWRRSGERASRASAAWSELGLGLRVRARARARVKANPP